MFAVTRISQFMIVFACSWLDFVVCLVRTRCFDNWLIFRFRFIALHAKMYLSFDEMFWQRLIFVAVFSLINTCFEMFSHQSARSKIVCMSDVFLLIILFDLQYFRIEFKMRFTSRRSIRKLFCTNDVFSFFARCTEVFVSLCQCECDLSEIVNFCLT